MGRARAGLTIRIVDALAAVYAVVIVVYAVIPQDWLGGEATTRGELLALRHHLLPVAALCARAAALGVVPRAERVCGHGRARGRGRRR